MAENVYCTVHTACGDFRGLCQDGLRVFRGIRFADSFRFHHNVPCPAHEGVYDATIYRSAPPQRTDRLVSVIGPEKGTVTEEGPLYLTVYAPAKANKLPVMVWIHGGSYLQGGSEEHRYSGRRLVLAGNVIVVKISYRLGALGYMLQEDGSCDFGLHDQISALRWVKDNIRGFGGDPDNITVFGQSAGAHSIAAIVSSCSEKPVFRRAILQSPPLGIAMSTQQAARHSAIFRKRLGEDPSDADCERILDVQTSMKGMNMGVPFMPVLDGGFRIPQCVCDAGTEFLTFYAAQDASPMVSKALGRLYPGILGRFFTWLWTRSIFSLPCLDYTSRLRSKGLKAHICRLDWYPEGSPLKSCHSLDLPFLLGEYEDWKDTKMLHGLSREEFDRISAIFLRTWTGFARDGHFEGLEIQGYGGLY